MKYLDHEISSKAMSTFLHYDGVLSFADAVTLELMKEFKTDTIVSFDSDFAKADGIIRIQ
ncbi:MAG TPA: PIN domain-containing protein [Methanobacteriaceae archaeon]|nr:PIN domain-containing protein [Methanobacteriaceae archaeon]